MLRFISCLLFLCSFFIIHAQSSNPWTTLDENSLRQSDLNRQIIPNKYETYSLNFTELKKGLNKAPRRFTQESKGVALPQVAFPMPNGQIEFYELMESNVMHPELAAKYPDIKTYVGTSRNGSGNVIHCGYSHKGFHGMIKSPHHSTVYIDTYADGTTDKYISYHRNDYSTDQTFNCLVEDEINQEKPSKISSSRFAGDCQLRIYDLALACTGEYAQFHGGTVPNVMAAYTNSMVRVNGIYETDLNVTMVLIANTDELIFLDAGDDPYTNESGLDMLSENQATIDNIIGLNNYDIGHVYSTGGGGIASLRSPCTNGRARGVTGLGSPIGDPFWVDYVAHEMGHQFGGNHTQNNDCNRVENAAVEPGSASTIMGYAGICPQNVQNNSDDHFNGYNIAEMQDFILGNGGSCPALAPNGNNAPEISVAETTYNLPISTPFILTAAGEDIDTDNVLTYCWEQQDAEVATMPPLPTNTGGPAFRSNSPTISPSRYFPNLDAIIAGTTPEWEVLPSVTRNMDFRCTLRDNNISGGCTAEADVSLDFDSNSGPFLVLVPNVGDEVWTVGENTLVEWDVANTNSTPINASVVDIYLSIDGGYTYPFLLLEGTSNDGIENIEVPQTVTEEARVMVKASGNIFFDISDENFIIQEPLVPTFTMTLDPLSQVGCPDASTTYDIQFQSFLEFDANVELNASMVPQGLTVVFTPSTANSSASSTLEVIGAESMDPGTYQIEVTAISGLITRVVQVDILILEPLVDANLLLPENGSSSMPTVGTSVEWDNIVDVDSYTIEVSTDPGFQTLVLSEHTLETIFDLPNLVSGTVYYWRVKGSNSCEEGEFGNYFAFQTIGNLECNTYESSDAFPIAFPPDITSVINIPNDDQIFSMTVNLDITHEWVGDITAILTGPNGTSATLFDQPGLPESQYGCNGSNIIVSLSDIAEGSAIELENSCEGAIPTISGNFQPLEPFSLFSGSSSQGPWTLSVNDLYLEEDDGALEYWSLEICKAETLPPAILINNTAISLPRGKSEIISNTNLLVDGTPSSITYRIRQLPSNGILELNGNAAIVGDEFTQVDINSANLIYIHNGGDSTSDSFLFDIVNDLNHWLPNQSFNIMIIENTLAAEASISMPLLCNDGNNGSIEVMISAGFEPFSYILNDGDAQSEPIFTDLSAGNYIVTVLDRFNCEVVLDELTIINPDAFTVEVEVNGNTIVVSTDGASGNLMYQLNDGLFQESNTFSNLNNGEYTIIVEDENGCQNSTTATIEVAGLQSSVSILTPITCYSVNDGAIEVEAIGGIPPYEYKINNEPYQQSNVFTSLGAGIYDLSVKDSEDMIIQATISLIEPDPLTGDIEVDLNMITVNAIGGTGELLYQLNSDDPQISNVFSGLENSMYSVVVIDENGCRLSLNATVNVAPLSLEVELISGVICHDGLNASVMLNASNGIPPYDYKIVGQPFQDASLFEGLASGNYTFRVRDSQGTIVNMPFTIDNPDPITGSIDIVNNQAIILASGGVGDLEYAISNFEFQSSNVFGGLENGDYTATIRDENGCLLELPFSVAIDALVGESLVSPLVSCFNTQDASITLSATGGVAPYTYSLNGSEFQNIPTFDGLGAGDYNPIIMDAIGQTIDLSTITLDNPTELTASSIVVGPTVIISAEGGTGTYMYSFDGAQFQSTNSFVIATNGGYSVVIEDSNGCSIQLFFEINMITGIDEEVIPVQCFGSDNGSITVLEVFDGIPPFSYALNGDMFGPSNTFNGLAPGDYSIRIMDDNGFIWEGLTLTITEPEALTIETQIVDNDLTILASGGSGNYEYSADNATSFQNSNVFLDLPNGDYTVIVIDEKFCSTSTTVTIDFVSSTTHITSDLDFVLLPNPNDGRFNIKLDYIASEPIQVEVFNLLGDLVISKELNGNESTHSIEVPTLDSGQYILKITNGIVYGSKKFVVLR